MHGPVSGLIKVQPGLPFSYKIRWLSFVLLSFSGQTGDLPWARPLQLFKAFLPVGPG